MGRKKNKGAPAAPAAAPPNIELIMQQLQQLGAAQTQMQTEMQTQRDEIAGLRAGQTELTGVRAALRAVEAHLAQQAIVNTALASRLQVEQHVGARALAGANASHVNTRLQLQRVSGERDAAQRTAGRLASQLESAAARSAATERELGQVRQELGRAEEELQSATARLATARLALVSESTARRNAERKWQASAARLALEGEYNETQSAAWALEAAEQRMLDESQLHANNVRSPLESESRRLQTRHEATCGQLREAKQQLADACRTVQQLTAELCRVGREMSAVEASEQREAAQAAVAQLEARLREAEAEVTQLRQANQLAAQREADAASELTRQRALFEQQLQLTPTKSSLMHQINELKQMLALPSNEAKRLLLAAQADNARLRLERDVAYDHVWAKNEQYKACLLALEQEQARVPERTAARNMAQLVTQANERLSRVGATLMQVPSEAAARRLEPLLEGHDGSPVQGTSQWRAQLRLAVAYAEEAIEESARQRARTQRNELNLADQMARARYFLGEAQLGAFGPAPDAAKSRSMVKRLFGALAAAFSTTPANPLAIVELANFN